MTFDYRSSRTSRGVALNELCDVYTIATVQQSFVAHAWVEPVRPVHKLVEQVLVHVGVNVQTSLFALHGCMAAVLIAHALLVLVGLPLYRICTSTADCTISAHVFQGIFRTRK
jgi:hypothetical protein